MTSATRAGSLDISYAAMAVRAASILSAAIRLLPRMRSQNRTSATSVAPGKETPPRSWRACGEACPRNWSRQTPLPSNCRAHIRTTLTVSNPSPTANTTTCLSESPCTSPFSVGIMLSNTAVGAKPRRATPLRQRTRLWIKFRSARSVAKPARTTEPSSSAMIADTIGTPIASIRRAPTHRQNRIPRQPKRPGPSSDARFTSRMISVTLAIHACQTRPEALTFFGPSDGERRGRQMLSRPSLPPATGTTA
jgi:hypothetical protein